MLIGFQGVVIRQERKYRQVVHKLDARAVGIVASAIVGVCDIEKGTQDTPLKNTSVSDGNR